jgi:Protein of unknown function (DUF2892)
MTIERIVHAIAGTLILLSVLLAYAWSPWFLALAVFVAANLLQSAFTRFCPLAIVLRLFGARDGASAETRSFR